MRHILSYSLLIVLLSIQTSDCISIKMYGRQQQLQTEYTAYAEPSPNYMLLQSDSSLVWWWFDDLKMNIYCKIWECQTKDHYEKLKQHHVDTCEDSKCKCKEEKMKVKNSKNITQAGKVAQNIAKDAQSRNTQEVEESIRQQQESNNHNETTQSGQKKDLQKRARADTPNQSGTSQSNDRFVSGKSQASGSMKEQEQILEKERAAEKREQKAEKSHEAAIESTKMNPQQEQASADRLRNEASRLTPEGEAKYEEKQAEEAHRAEAANMTAEQKAEAKIARQRAEESSIEIQKVKSLTTDGFVGGGSPEQEAIANDPALSRMESETSALVNKVRERRAQDIENKGKQMIGSGGGDAVEKAQKEYRDMTRETVPGIPSSLNSLTQSGPSKYSLSQLKLQDLKIEAITNDSSQQQDSELPDITNDDYLLLKSKHQRV